MSTIENEYSTKLSEAENASLTLLQHEAEDELHAEMFNTWELMILSGVSVESADEAVAAQFRLPLQRVSAILDMEE